jgi:hypothetical protein
MPEYLAPGVFIEETSFRHKSIEGVGTSVSSLVGPTRTGPLRGTPEVVTSFNQFVRTFGEIADLNFAGVRVPNYTGLAAKAFFENGGKQLFVSRIINGINQTDANGDLGSAIRASRASADNTLKFSSRFPGEMGNYTLEIHWRDSINLFATEKTTTPDAGETLYLSATEILKEAKVNAATLVDAKFPISVNALVKRQGANLTLLFGEAKDKDGKDINFADLDSKLVTAQLPATSALTRVILKNPVTGNLASGDAIELTLSAESDISKFTGAAHWGSLKVLRGSLIAAPASGPINKLSLPKSINDGLAADLDVPIAALAALPPGVTTLMVQRNFDLEIHSGGMNGEVIYSLANLTTARDQANSLDKALPAAPEKRENQLNQPIACKIAAAGDVLGALNSLFEAKPINSPDPLNGPRYLITLSGGSDGNIPNAADYAGEVDEIAGSTGLAALEGIEDISIVMTPAAAAHEGSHKAVIMEVQKHCQKMRYRIGLADSRQGMSLGEVRAFRNDFDDNRLALYHPWVIIADPTGQRTELAVPPAGFIAGIYVRTDVERGVHKAPANEVVMGALRFEQEINKFQQELLNPNGINCLRSFAGRGHRVWGGRTLCSDPEWKYVNVRRYFLYLERSIEKSTQWAVFEPNGEALWANIRSTVEDFVFNEWKNGRLLGSTPKEAYFVRCDRSTMTQNDIDNGRMVCVVGVAALTPAEFVIFRIGQKTADA